MRKRIVFIMSAFIFALVGCASVEPDQDEAPVPTEMTISVENPQTPVTELENKAAEDTTTTDDKRASMAQGEEKNVSSLDFETLTGPPTLTISTINNTDSIIVSYGNSHWRDTLPDGTITTVLACGAHPLDQQEHPILYTAFPAGTLPPLEEGADVGSIVPVFYLDFGENSPTTVSAIRWPASYIGDAISHTTDFEEVEVEFEEDLIILLPLGDGDFVYEISAEWGEVGGASYTFRTIPQIRGEQEVAQTFDESRKYSGSDQNEIFKAVLLGDSPFICCSGGNGETMVITDISAFFDEYDPLMKVWDFSIVDLNGDGEDEVILFVVGIAGDSGGKVILHQIGDKVYGYSTDNRTLVDLKTDGTYSYSDPTGVNEVGFATVVDFSETEYIEDKITYATGTYNGFDKFVADHQPVTEEEYFDSISLQDQKQNAEWYEFTDENINKMFGGL